MRREPVEQEVVFGSPAAVLRPVGEIVGIDRSGVRRHRDQKLDAASMKRRVHARDKVDRIGHAVVAHDEPRALLHRLLTEVEEAALAANQHRTVARAQERLGQILVGPDQNLPKAEVIAEEGVDARRQRQPIGAGAGNRWRRREIAPLLEIAAGGSGRTTPRTSGVARRRKARIPKYRRWLVSMPDQDREGSEQAPSSRGAGRSLASRRMLRSATRVPRLMDRRSRPLQDEGAAVSAGAMKSSRERLLSAGSGMRKRRSHRHSTLSASSP